MFNATYASLKESEEKFNDTTIEVYSIGSNKSKFAFVQKDADGNLMADLRFMDVNDSDEVLDIVKEFLGKYNPLVSNEKCVISGATTYAYGARDNLNVGASFEVPNGSEIAKACTEMQKRLEEEVYGITDGPSCYPFNLKIDRLANFKQTPLNQYPTSFFLA